MGHPAAMIRGARPADEVEADGVRVDQAIFTSVRSGAGEGYRVIAASSGVRPEEKADITRRSPSHGGLCDDGPQATGLMTYKIATGRHCIAYCCHAGAEHTGRGGQRVYTHALLLDRSGYRLFHSSPIQLHDILARQIARSGPQLKPLSRLEPVFLNPPSTGLYAGSGFTSFAANASVTEWAMAAAAQLILGRPLVLLDVPHPMALLERALMSVPLYVREAADASVGVRYSSGRRMRLVLLGHDDQVQRRLVGQNLSMCSMEQAPPAVDPLLEPWCALIGRWWREGRRLDIQRLTTQLCDTIPPDSLPRIAAICEDIDAIARLTGEGVRQVASRYDRESGRTPAERELIEQLREAARLRMRHLAAGVDSPSALPPSAWVR